MDKKSRLAAKVGPECVQNQWKSDDSRFRRFRASELNVSVSHAPVEIEVWQNAPAAPYGPDFVRGVAKKKKYASRTWFSHS